MALFKIFNNIDSKTPIPGEQNKYTWNGLPNTYHKGYMYFDASKNLFYIDLSDNSEDRVALNAWAAYKAYGDEDGLSIKNNYLKISDVPKITIKTWTGTPV